MATELPEHEMRRAPRIPADFWVMVQGVDDALVMRRGNISTSGIIFGADGLDVDLGSLEFLHITSADKVKGVVIMAQAVRIVQLQGGPPGAPSMAMAFEFMAENPARRDEIEAFVDYLSASDEVKVDAPESAELAKPASGMLFPLEISRMWIETTWPVDVGDKVQLVVRPGQGQTRIPFEGTVQAVHANPDLAGPSRYRVETTSMRAGQRHAGIGSITESVDIAIQEMMASGATADLATERPHMRGRLDRISLPDLLGWFEVGRISGRVRVQGPQDERATLYLDGGRLLDIDSVGNPEPLVALQSIAGWQAGRFELHEGEVTRPDRLKMSTSGVLLELARIADESDKDDLSNVA